MKFLGPVEDAEKSWKRCYRGSNFEFSSTAFHAHCDNKGPTVVIIKVGDFVFGGYTDQSWKACKSVLHSLCPAELETATNTIASSTDIAALATKTYVVSQNYD